MGRSPPTRNRCDRYGKAEPPPPKRGNARPLEILTLPPQETTWHDDVTGPQVRTSTWHLPPVGSRHVARVGSPPGRVSTDLHQTRALSGLEVTRTTEGHVRAHDWCVLVGPTSQLKCPIRLTVECGILVRVTPSERMLPHQGILRRHHDDSWQKATWLVAGGQVPPLKTGGKGGVFFFCFYI